MTLRRFCAFALAVTAAIHLAVVPEHLREWPLAAAFFVALAVGEAVLAGIVLRTTQRRLLVIGAAVSVASAALWSLSRSTGLPFGPGAFSPEAISAPDVVATALEVFAALVFLRLVGIGRARRPAIAAAVAAVFLTGACSSSPSATTQKVAIDTFMFSPHRVHVHPGDTVEWTNHDGILHTVTSGTRDYDPTDSGRVVATRKSGAFDFQLDGKGATAKFTFKKKGAQHYFCDRHPGMEADIDVS